MTTTRMISVLYDTSGSTPFNKPAKLMLLRSFRVQTRPQLEPERFWQYQASCTGASRSKVIAHSCRMSGHRAPAHFEDDARIQRGGSDDRVRFTETTHHSSVSGCTSQHVGRVKILQNQQSVPHIEKETRGEVASRPMSRPRQATNKFGLCVRASHQRTKNYEAQNKPTYSSRDYDLDAGLSIDASLL